MIGVRCAAVVYEDFAPGFKRITSRGLVEPGRKTYFVPFEVKNNAFHGIKHIQNFIRRKTTITAETQT